jgi:hypothetical protein
LVALKAMAGPNFSPFRRRLVSLQVASRDQATGWTIRKRGALQTIKVGCQTYTKSQAIAIMKQSTSKDMTYALAAQLIAAKLNANCAGANSSCVSSAISNADNFLCVHAVGSKVAASSSAWQGISSTYDTLENYNQGKLCATQCER